MTEAISTLHHGGEAETGTTPKIRLLQSTTLCTLGLRPSSPKPSQTPLCLKQVELHAEKQE